MLVVAYDVLGGIWAINGGALPGDPGEVSYWGPDDLAWTSVLDGYGSFLQWAFEGGTADFYSELRWTGWEQEVDPLALDHGLHVHPPLWSQEGQDIAAASRKPVPFVELLASNQEMADQLNATGAGTVALQVGDE